MAVADPQQLRALVNAVVAPGDRRRVIAVRADPVWHEPSTIEGTRPITVVACASPLAVRAALVDHDPTDDTVLAILTPCPDRELGLDVLASLAKGRVLPMDPYAAVLALFGARVLDPTLVRDDRWLVDELIALAPPGGWTDALVAPGVLDADTAWDVWHRARIGHPVPGDLDAVLALGADPAVAATLDDLGLERRQRVAARWAGDTAAGLLADLIASGNGRDVTPLGLVAEVLWAVTDDPTLADLQRVGRARLELLLGRDRLDRHSAGAWSDASRRTMNGDVAVLDRAEQLLAGADVRALAVLSNELPAGFDLKLAAVAAAVDAGALDQADSALQALGHHRLARTRPTRVLQAAAAVRIARRRSTAPPALVADELAALAVRYAEDGSWVDEARLLLADGDQLPEVAAVYARLCGQVDDERRTGDLAFATALARWSAAEPVADPRLLPLENVLDQVVARVALDAPVLVVVADGLSLAVAHHLLTSLAEEGWTRAMPSDIDSWPVGVAMLPTITEVSRTSLLTGTRLDGGSKDEAQGFADHAGLRRVSKTTKPPVVFHKGRLVGPSGHLLADDVNTAVADPDQRVVGVVINAIDDHLSRGQQIKVTWDVPTMGPLAALLEAARDAGRVVVLTADHGHVIHGEAVLRPAEGGERWRKHTSPPVSDEVEVAGPRVLKGGRVVLPADDRIRYGGHGHGYHGGACPQEVLVPIEVLARTLPDGWVHRPLPRPTWWSAASAPPMRDEPVPPPSIGRGRPMTTPQPTLFEPEPPTIAPPAAATAAPDDLIDQLVGSAVLADQRQRNRIAHAVSDERLATYLREIRRNGDRIPLATLAERTGEPTDQLRMALMMARRLLNFDGTEVLALTAGADVELNADVLAVQFDLTAG
ncbi:MAG: BREX-2 system phosphatase PglZ [Desertimonas sp.]